MQYRKKKANDVRYYFIILRKFIDYYKDHFANKINELVCYAQRLFCHMYYHHKNNKKNINLLKNYILRCIPVGIHLKILKNNI